MVLILLQRIRMIYCIVMYPHSFGHGASSNLLHSVFDYVYIKFVYLVDFLTSHIFDSTKTSHISHLHISWFVTHYDGCTCFIGPRMGLHVLIRRTGLLGHACAINTSAGTLSKCVLLTRLLRRFASSLSLLEMGCLRLFSNNSLSSWRVCYLVSLEYVLHAACCGNSLSLYGCFSESGKIWDLAVFFSNWNTVIETI